MADSSPLLDFMIELSENADLRDRFAADPESVLAESSLSDADKDAVRTRDNARVRAQVHAELGSDRPPGTITYITSKTTGWSDDE